MVKNKPFRLLPAASNCWTSGLMLDGARALGQQFDVASNPPKVLILYGSLRKTSYSRMLAYEYARILEDLGCDVQVFNPRGLPVKDDVSDNDPKVTELRNLSIWSEGQIWVSPEQHGTITGVFKNMIDWIPLSVGSVRPTQGRVLAVSQVNGGSQSFNSVNTLRVLGRWMRMVTIPNQSSIPKAWTEFEMVEGLTDELELPVGRLKASSFRDRVVDVAEEFFKFMVLLRDKTDFLVDRYSEREERKVHGRLLPQAEKEENPKK
ncbi:NADPH-dependent FMN reductase [Chytriomyces cf. hyalinus JEL632]|nr:NADPH-dependent FMN reductase [Chytriomyces cf. hyalinus JEL632]